MGQKRIGSSEKKSRKELLSINENESVNKEYRNRKRRRTKTMAKITYTNINGYLIPNHYKSNEQMEQLGGLRILRKNYLKKHKIHYTSPCSYRNSGKTFTGNR